LELWFSLGLLAVALLGLGIWALYARARRKRRAALFAQAFPDAWIEILERNVPLYNALPEPLKRQLRGHINIFLAEKKFIGCAGLEVTDEVRVTVAAGACVLMLNRKARYYPGLSTIFVYPEAYVAEGARATGGGGVLIQEQARAGESWQHGPIVLSWDGVRRGAADVRDGHNVVLHEFAHQLDQADGEADGAPDLGARSRYVSWARVLGREYEKLVARARRGRGSTLDRYGATNPAEFFAVLTETFFEKPKKLKRKHPELYEEAKGFYRLDPLEWG